MTEEQKAKRRAAARKWYANNKERANANKRAWRAKNKDKIHEYNVKYYRKAKRAEYNKAKRAEYNRKWRAEHPNYWKDRAAKLKSQNPKVVKMTEREKKDLINARLRERYATDPEFRQATKDRMNKWRTSPEGRAKFNAHQREYMREYRQRPEVRERRRKYEQEYNKRPEVIARRRARAEALRAKNPATVVAVVKKRKYIPRSQMTPEQVEKIRAARRAYYHAHPEKQKANGERWRKSPKGRAKFNARMREYMREYSKRPEVKAKRAAWVKEYMQRPEVKARRSAYSKGYQAGMKRAKSQLIKNITTRVIHEFVKG